MNTALLTLDSVEHEENSHDTSDKHSQPQSRILQDVTGAETRLVKILVLTAGQLQWRRHSPTNNVQSTRAETDDCQEQADSTTDGGGERSGNEPDDPLSESEDGEREEDDTFQEDGGQGFAVGDRSGSLKLGKLELYLLSLWTRVEADLTVGKVRIDYSAGSATVMHGDCFATHHRDLERDRGACWQEDP